MFDHGPWDEDLLWFFGPEAIEADKADVQQISHKATSGGYYVLRYKDAFALTRCTSYSNRPGQADMLSVDLWRHGKNVLIDPGTYLYYAEPPWDNGLVGTSVHNTVSIAGQDQMVRGPRFLWLEWTKSRVVDQRESPNRFLESFQGEHYGYSRLNPPVVHRRTIIRCYDSIWIVVDDLLGIGEQSFSLQWLLPFNGEYNFDQQKNNLKMNLSEDLLSFYWYVSVIKKVTTSFSGGKDEEAPRGWYSRYYGVKEPALSFLLNGQGNFPCRLMSVFSLGHENISVSFQDKKIEVNFDMSNKLGITLSKLDIKSSFTKIKADLNSGATSEYLETGDLS